jgi:hypothetical protein
MKAAVMKLSFRPLVFWLLCCCERWQVSCKGLAGQSYDAAASVLAAAAAEASAACPGLLLLDDLDLLTPAATGDGQFEQV